MIPGVISTGLESWGTDPPSRPYFRKRLWGSWSMMRALVLDKAGWKKHIMLDKATGLDPPGIKLRAAQGFDATDLYALDKRKSPPDFLRKRLLIEPR